MTIRQPLFREEVLAARRGEWLGAINVALPMSRWLLTGMTVALAGAIVLFLVFGQYTRRDRVPGQLVPSAGLIAVEATAAGRIRRVDVHQGQAVRQGDALVDISRETDSARLGDTRARISARLRGQRERLLSDLDTQRKASDVRVRQLHRQRKLLAAKRRQLRAQLALQKKRTASDQSLLTRMQPLLAKGYVSGFRVQQQQSQVLADDGQEKVLASQELDIEQQLGQVRQALAQVPLDLISKTNATRRQLGQVEQQLAENEAQRDIVLRAPRDGVVTAVLARAGQTASAGQPLLSIMPAGSRLQAQLLVPSRAIGFVEPGSRVVLRYQAYPYQKFGQQYGKVEQVSRSALSAAAVVALTGQRPQQPLYRVKVALERQDVVAYGKPQPLKPGMAVSADILMDRRSLLEWAFEPLYGLARGALKERADG
ncbi:MAG TPA: HlyD family efflux transporter periplasmic adaptor subunit [Rhodanobacteraceae bacterium]|nr:HlyD family efflux transporter periplasmic adaptor subunit [Rhodanobacteraceae bacterium]